LKRGARIAVGVAVAATVSAGTWLLAPPGTRWRLSRWSDAALVTHIASQPADAEAHWELAARLQRRGRAGEAVAAYIRVGEAEPGKARGWVAAGDAALVAHDLRTAMRAADQAIHAEPRSASAQRLLGDVRAAQGDYAGAQALYGEALRRAPDDALSWLGSVRTHLARREYDAAAAAGQRATELAPDSGPAWTALGEARLRLGDLLAAQSALETALTRDARAVDALTLRGEVAASRPASRAEAEGFYTRAIAAADGSERAVEPLCALGSLRLDLGRFADADQSYRRALALRPDDTEALFGRSRALMFLGRSSEAATLRRRFEARSRYELEVSHLQLRIGRDPSQIALWNQLGALHAANGSPEKAVPVWERSLQLDPNQPTIRAQMSRLNASVLPGR
jgi:tetratricopeptide (TPR) repeat protein